MIKSVMKSLWLNAGFVFKASTRVFYYCIAVNQIHSGTSFEFKEKSGVGKFPNHLKILLAFIFKLFTFCTLFIATLTHSKTKQNRAYKGITFIPLHKSLCFSRNSNTAIRSE